MAFKAGAIYGEATLETKKWKSGLKSLTKGAAITGAAITAVFTKILFDAVKAADVFQKKMSNVNTLLEGTAISTQDLTKSLLKLDPALGGVTELTKGMYQAFSAGAETAEEAIQTTVDAAKFAKAALTDTNTAVDVLTTAVNAYGKETVSTTQASDIFFTTIKKGKITGEQLAGSIGQSIPLFASAGIKLEELASGMAAMTKQGVSASESTTQLNAIVNSFLKPSEKMTELLQKIGYESGAAFLKAEGLSGALKLIETNTKGDATQIAKLLPNIRAMRGAMALTGVGGREFNKTLETMGDATGATDKAFQKQEKTFETLKNSLGKTQIIIGNIAKSFVDEIAAGATTANEAIKDFLLSTKAAEIFGKVIGTVAGVFSVIKDTVQPIIDVIGPGLKRIFDAIAKAGDKMSKKGAEGAGAFKILAVVSKLVAVGFTLMSKAIASAITFISNLVDIVMKTAGVLGGFFEALAGRISWDEFGKRVEAAGDAFGNLVTDLVIDTVSMVDTTIQEFSRFGEETDKLAEKTKDNFESTVKITTKVIQNTWDSLITGQEKSAGEVEGGVNDLVEDIKDGNEEIIDDTEETTKTWVDLWTESIDSISNYYDKINEVISFGLDQISELFMGDLENQNAELENSYRLREEALQENLENELITQAEFDEQSKQLEEEKRKEQNELGKKQFENQKAFNIASTIMDTASAVMGWWRAAPQLGPFAGPIFGAAMTAATIGFGVARVAQISAQEFVPQFQLGGTKRGTGLANINEAGGEILELQDGTKIIPNDISRDIAAASGRTQNINLTINNPVIQDEKMLNKLTARISQILGQQLRLQT